MCDVCHATCDLSDLAVPAPDVAPLVAHRQPPAATHPATLEHITAVFSLHSMQKSVLPTPRNTLGLPCSLRHSLLFLMFQGRTTLSLSFHDNGRAARATPVANNLNAETNCAYGREAERHYT
jgi:hypothetical protein